MEEPTPSAIDVFVGITQRVIARDGFDGYLPTALYPARKRILVLEGVPPDADLETVSLNWAQANAVGTEELFVAFPISATHFKVIHRVGGALENGIFPAVPTT